MKPYRIVTDATSDLSQEIAAMYEILVIPMTVTFDGSEKIHSTEDVEFMRSDFYQKLREGAVATTAQINMYQFVQIFSTILEQKQDILYIGFSSAMSGTYQAAVAAMEELKEKWPERTMRSVDSLAASSGEGLLVVSAANMKKEGKSLEEVREWTEENKHFLNTWVTVDDLEFLQRGGRISATEAFFGNILGVKPIIHVNIEGRLVPIKKVRGRKQALKLLVASMEGYEPGYANQTIYIAHGDCPEDAQSLAKMVQEKYQPEDLQIFNIGPVVGSHSGPGTIAVFYYAQHRSVQGV